MGFGLAIPILRVSSIDAAVDYYTRALGFTRDWGGPIFASVSREKASIMRDFHATILELLGLEQNRLWFLHNGRNEKLTDFGGNVIREMIA